MQELDNVPACKRRKRELASEETEQKRQKAEARDNEGAKRLREAEEGEALVHDA